MSWGWFLLGLLLSVVLILTFTVFTVKEGALIYYHNPVVVSETISSKITIDKNLIEWIVMDKYPILPKIKQRYDNIARQGIVKEFTKHAVSEEIMLPELAELPELTESTPVIKEILQINTVELDQMDLDEMPDDEESDKTYSEKNICHQETTMTEPVILTHAVLQQMTRVPEDMKIVTTNIKSEPTIVRSKRKGDNGPISELIELILYINEEDHKNQKIKIEQEIKRIFNKDDRIDTSCIRAETREDGKMGKLLSHITALSLACEQQRNVMVLEDDFEFYMSRDDIQKHLKLVQDSFHDRWNVIVLGQYTYDWNPVATSDDENIQLMRLLQCSSTCGYIVNRTYLPTLLNIWIEHMYQTISISNQTIGILDSSVKHDYLDEIQNRLQSQDIWLGFEKPIGGHKLHIKPFDPNTVANKVRSKWTVQDIGIYVKTSNQTQKELNELLRHLYLDAHKGHRLHIAVHHKANQKFVNKHRRSYSSSFYSGVQYFSTDQEVQDFLKPFDIVQWIDLEKWTNKDDLEKLLKLVSQPIDSSTANSSSDIDSYSITSGSSSESGSESGYIPCLSKEQRKHFLDSESDMEELVDAC